MIRARHASSSAVVLASMLQAAITAAYPEEPIRIVVPFAPGGGSDLVARFLQNGLEKGLGGPIIVDNRPGAGGTLGSTLVARSAPDGYTFLVTSASFTFSPSIYKDPAHDAVKGFTFITNISTTPLVLDPVRAQRAVWREGPARRGSGSGAAWGAAPRPPGFACSLALA